MADVIQFWEMQMPTHRAWENRHEFEKGTLLVIVDSDSYSLFCNNMKTSNLCKHTCIHHEFITCDAG